MFCFENTYMPQLGKIFTCGNTYKKDIIFPKDFFKRKTRGGH